MICFLSFIDHKEEFTQNDEAISLLYLLDGRLLTGSDELKQMFNVIEKKKILLHYSLNNLQKIINPKLNNHFNSSPNLNLFHSSNIATISLNSEENQSKNLNVDENSSIVQLNPLEIIQNEFFRFPLSQQWIISVNIKNNSNFMFCCKFFSIIVRPESNSNEIEFNSNIGNENKEKGILYEVKINSPHENIIFSPLETKWICLLVEFQSNDFIKSNFYFDLICECLHFEEDKENDSYYHTYIGSIFISLENRILKENNLDLMKNDHCE